MTRTLTSHSIETHTAYSHCRQRRNDHSPGGIYEVGVNRCSSIARPHRLQIKAVFKLKSTPPYRNRATDLCWIDARWAVWPASVVIIALSVCTIAVFCVLNAAIIALTPVIAAVSRALGSVNCISQSLLLDYCKGRTAFTNRGTSWARSPKAVLPASQFGWASS